MSWEKLLKQPEEPIEEEATMAVGDRQAGKTIGTYADLINEISIIISNVRKKGSEQRNALGQIRQKITDAGIPAIQE
jgi:hypothetical protein